VTLLTFGPARGKDRLLTTTALALATLLAAAPAVAQATAQSPATATSSSKKTDPPAKAPSANQKAAPTKPEPAKPQDPKPPAGTKVDDASKPPKPKPAGPPALRVSGFFEVGYQSFVAKDTFDAALGKTGGGVLGGGASLTHRSGLLFQVDITKFAADGERAFVHDGEIFTLGIPLRVEILPVEFTFGYKFFTRPPSPKKPPKPAVTPTPPKRNSWSSPLALDQGKPQAPPAKPAAAGTVAAAARPWGGLKPYVGGGFGIVSYTETSDFASGDDDVDDSFTSAHVLGGVEIPIWRWLGASAEVNYRWVKDALGEAGLSKAFGEDDLGGPSFRVKLTVGM
jgi:opacity protein-like surface antigen